MNPISLVRGWDEWTKGPTAPPNAACGSWSISTNSHTVHYSGRFLRFYESTKLNWQFFAKKMRNVRNLKKMKMSILFINLRMGPNLKCHLLRLYHFFKLHSKPLIIPGFKIKPAY